MLFASPTARCTATEAALGLFPAPHEGIEGRLAHELHHGAWHLAAPNCDAHRGCEVAMAATLNSALGADDQQRPDGLDRRLSAAVDDPVPSR